MMVRAAEPGDAAFVVGSWVDSYRTAHAAGMIPMGAYDRVYREAVAAVLSRPGVSVFVACHPREVEDIYGWAAVERGASVPVREREDGRWVERLSPCPLALVHYVYVKQPYRRMGLARALLAAAGVDPAGEFLYTCKTAVVSRLPLPRARWAPLVARYERSS